MGVYNIGHFGRWATIEHFDFIWIFIPPCRLHLDCIEKSFNNLSSDLALVIDNREVDGDPPVPMNC